MYPAPINAHTKGNAMERYASFYFGLEGWPRPSVTAVPSTDSEIDQFYTESRGVTDSVLLILGPHPWLEVDDGDDRRDFHRMMAEESQLDLIDYILELLRKHDPRRLKRDLELFREMEREVLEEALKQP